MKKCKEFCSLKNDNTCCYSCDLQDVCEDACGNDPSVCEQCVNELTQVVTFESKALQVMQTIHDIAIKKKELDVQDANMREELQKYMTEFGILNFENDLLKITNIAPTTRTTVDSKKLKAELPEIYKKYSKTSAVKGSVRIEAK